MKKENIKTALIFTFFLLFDANIGFPGFLLIMWVYLPVKLFLEKLPTNQKFYKIMIVICLFVTLVLIGNNYYQSLYAYQKAKKVVSSVSSYYKENDNFPENLKEVLNNEDSTYYQTLFYKKREFKYLKKNEEDSMLSYLSGIGCYRYYYFKKKEWSNQGFCYHH